MTSTIPPQVLTPTQIAFLKQFEKSKCRERQGERIKAWTKMPRVLRNWICFAEIVEWCAGTGIDRSEREKTAWLKLTYSVILEGHFVNKKRPDKLYVAYIPFAGKHTELLDPFSWSKPFRQSTSIQNSLHHNGKPLNLRLDITSARAYCGQKIPANLTPILEYCWTPRELAITWLLSNGYDVPTWLPPAARQAAGAADSSPKVKREGSKTFAIKEAMRAMGWNGEKPSGYTDCQAMGEVMKFMKSTGISLSFSIKTFRTACGKS